MSRRNRFIKQYAPLIGILLLGIFLAPHVPADDDLQALQHDLSRALKRLGKGFENLKGRGHYTDRMRLVGEDAVKNSKYGLDFWEKPTAPDILLEADEISFSILGDLKKREVTTLQERRKKAGSKSNYSSSRDDWEEVPPNPDRKKRITCRGRDIKFRLTENSKGELVLDNFGDRTESPAMIIVPDTFLEAPYAGCPTLMDFLRSGDPGPSRFVVRGTSEVVVDGEREKRIDFVLTGPFFPESPRRPGQPSKGWATVLPDRGWAIRQMVLSTDEVLGAYNIQVAYGGEEGGVPIPSRVTITRGPRRSELEITEFHLGQAKESEFTLSHYGLPDLQAPATRGGNRTGVVLLACGVVGLAVAVGLGVLARRGHRG